MFVRAVIKKTTDFTDGSYHGTVIYEDVYKYEIKIWGTEDGLRLNGEVLDRQFAAPISTTLHASKDETHQEGQGQTRHETGVMNYHIRYEDKLDEDDLSPDIAWVSGKRIEWTAIERPRRNIIQTLIKGDELPWDTSFDDERWTTHEEWGRQTYRTTDLAKKMGDKSWGFVRQDESRWINWNSLTTHSFFGTNQTSIIQTQQDEAWVVTYDESGTRPTSKRGHEDYRTGSFYTYTDPTENDLARSADWWRWEYNGKSMSPVRSESAHRSVNRAGENLVREHKWIQNHTFDPNGWVVSYSTYDAREFINPQPHHYWRSRTNCLDLIEADVCEDESEGYEGGQFVDLDVKRLEDGQVVVTGIPREFEH